MTTDRIRTTTHLHLDTHPEARFRVRNIGRTSADIHPTFVLDVDGDGSWTDVHLHLDLAQLRQLRAVLVDAIEPAVAGLTRPVLEEVPTDAADYREPEGFDGETAERPDFRIGPSWNGLSRDELAVLAALYAHGPHVDPLAIPGVRAGRASLRTLGSQGLLALIHRGTYAAWELTELGREVYLASLPEGVSVDEAVQRG